MANEINRSVFNPLVSLPPQMISLSQKNDQWKKDMGDALERIGKAQMHHNFSLVENYEIIKGKFIFHHYFETQGYDDMLGQLTKEFDLPKYLRHYDIISQVVNVLSGEYQKRPDNFKVRATDEISTNELIRTKSRLLLEHVLEKINAETNLQLTDEGLDPNRTGFESDEEAAQYQEAVQERRRALTPPEIENYMTMNYSTVAEKWGQAQLKQDKQRFNLPELERVEFEDMLTADRCFRHFYLSGDDYRQETWNTINTFFHHAQEVRRAEDGDYAGRIIFLSPASIIDRYGWRMTKQQINTLKRVTTKNKIRKGNKGVNYLGLEYGATVPFQNFEDFKRLEDAYVPAPGEDKFQSEGFLNSVMGSKGYSIRNNGQWQITEAYFKSQKKIGKVIYIDPETGQLAKTLVDESFILPLGFTEVDSSIYDSDQPNTVTWTWVNETRDIIKLNPLFGDNDDCIYLGGDPLPFQFKSDYNPYGCKLPVCGGIFNNRNGESAALVDMMKPHQIGYNVAINQLYQLMEREVGRFLVMDVNILPKAKDWGGEKGWEKWMMVARGLGFAPADTSVKNMSGAVTGGHFPNVVDLDESARMMSRMEIANWFEQKALSQVGITPQRLGTTSASESATGVQQAVSQSYAQTESFFTRFNDYKARCLRMSLDIAQYVQSTKENVTVQYTKDDMSRAFMKVNGTELSLADLGIFVTNSQEDLRQLETMRQLFMENNTTGATALDLADVVMINSPLEIRARLEKSLKTQQEREGQMQQLEQQKIQSAQEMQDKAQAFEAEQNQLDREAKLEEAYIKTFGGANNVNTSDVDASGTPDVLEYDKFNMARDQNNRKLDLQEQKQNSDLQLANRKEILEREKLAQKDRSDMAKLKVARENKNKSDTKK
jgi:hypothetical protein